MKLKLAITFATLAFLVGSVASAVFEDWPFVIPVTINNQTGGILTDQWVRIDDFPALDLINGNYMLSDAGDVRMVTPTSTNLDVFAQTLGSDVATWWFQVPSLPINPSTYYMHLGKAGETRDQALGLVDTDAVTVPDDASLDVTTRLSMESLGTTLETIPAAETWLLNKEDAYGLGVRSTNTVFAYIMDAASTTQEMLVDSAGDEENIPLQAGGGGCAGAGNHWQCVDEAKAAPDDTNYVVANAAPETRDLYNLAPPGGFTPVDEIVSVTVNFRGLTTSIGCAALCWIKPHIKLGGVVESGAQWTLANAFGNFTEILGRPGGGDWEFTDFAALQAGVSMSEGGGNQSWASQVSITVTYRNREEALFTPIFVDTAYDFQATYDGVNLRLYVDDVLCTPACAGVTPTGITVNSNANTVDVGPFDGLVERTLVDDGSQTFDDLSTTNVNITSNAPAATTILDTDFDDLGRAINFFNATALSGGSPAARDNIFDGGGTIEYCARPTAVAALDRMLAKRFGFSGWHIASNGFGRLQFRFEFTVGNGTWDSDGGYHVNNRWDCYAVVYNADAVANNPLFYRRGVAGGTGVGAAPVGVRVSDAGDLLDIGAGAGAAFFAGDMAELRIWNDVRTPAEILANWNIPIASPLTEANLVGYFRFEEARVLDYTYEPNTVDETADGIAAATAVLTADAAAGQKDVEVPDGTLFKIQQDVTISDDTPDTETNVIASILGDTLTMVTNLANAYTTGQNAQVVGDAWEFKGTIEGQSDSANDGTYLFTRIMANLDPTKGPLEIKEFSVGEFPIPTPIGGVQLPLDTTMAAPINGQNIPLIGPIVAAFSAATSLNMTFVFIWLFIGMALAALVGIYLRTKEHMMALAACGMVLAVGSGFGVYTWFIFIAYIILAGSAVVVIQRR